MSGPDDEDRPAAPSWSADGPHRRYRREDFPPDPPPHWSGADDTGWQAYHRQLFDLVEGEDPFAGRSSPPNAFARWKILSTGVSVARHLAGARSRGRVAWTLEHGEDDQAWPLAHPPAVLWVPETAFGACLRCLWLGRGASDLDAAAVLARAHSSKHAALDLAGPTAAAALRDRPVDVWSREGGTHEPVRTSAG